MALLAFSFMLSVFAPALFAVSFIETEEPDDASVSLGGDGNNAMQLNPSDVVAVQFFTTAEVLALSFSMPSFNNDSGSVTVALFEFNEDYFNTVEGVAVAEHTFENFKDNSELTIRFDENDPLSAGEYLLVLYDAKDDNPGSGGGTGIGIWYGGGHESQRFYKNGEYDGNTSMPLNILYKNRPEKNYEIPTVPEIGTDIDMSPKMDSVIYFSDPDEASKASAGNQTKVEYTDGFTRISTSGAASDPYAFVDLSSKGSVIDTGTYKAAVIKMRKSEGAPSAFQVFFTTSVTGLSEAASIKANYKDTSEWQYVILNFATNGLYTGELKSLRWDIFQSTETTAYVDIDYVALFTCVEAAESFAGNDNFEDFEETGQGGDEGMDNVKGVEIKDPDATLKPYFEENGQRSFYETRYTYTMDFTDSLQNYSASKGFGFTSIGNAYISEETLRCRAFTGFSLYSKEILGDKYALTDGVLSFDMNLESGNVTVGTRLLYQSDDFEKSGIYFRLTNGSEITVSEKSSGCEVTVDVGKDLSGLHSYSFKDCHDEILICCDDEVLLTIKYDRTAKEFEVFDSSGKSHGKFTSEILPECGYFSVSFNRMKGYVDNISYNNSVITQKRFTPEYETDYSTWVATDDLDRTTPLNPDAGDAKEKYVGLFYFIFHSDDTTGKVINDVTEMYLNGGAQNVTDTLSSFAGRNGAYWAEPYFGYYTSNDVWVYRKHASMLSAAGVDFIFLDLSNNKFYTEQVTLLFDTWLQMRKEGMDTPQICMMFGDMPYTTLNGLYTLLDPIYNNEEYKELLFCYEGKPLLLGNTDTPKSREWTNSTGTTPQSKAEYLNLLEQNPEVKEFYENEYQSVLERFTVRKCWAWQAGTHDGYWDWLQESPQALGTDSEGNPEQISVSLGVHAHTSRGRSYVNSMNNYNKEGEYGFRLTSTPYGKFFEEQFEYALTQDVNVLMITGWNEWYAGVQSTANQNQTTGQTLTPGFYMVDQCSPEYSRDGEPMKIRDGVGFGDNYYYQMVSYIRKFKGIDEAQKTVNGGTVNMGASDIDAQWEGIGPVFTDGVNDISFRSEYSWAGKYLYVNNTARNDISYAKISQDSENIYFYVRTANDMINVDSEDWMNLFVDIDSDTSTGWEGFDFRINSQREGNKTSVEKFVDGKWEFESVGEADMILGDRSITIRVSKSILGVENGTEVSFNFKWADNSVTDGDVMKFMELGDAAPDDRFAFAYTANGLEDNRGKNEESTGAETEGETGTSDTEPVDDIGGQNGCNGCKSSLGAGVAAVASITAVGCVSAAGKKRKK